MASRKANSARARTPCTARPSRPTTASSASNAIWTAADGSGTAWLAQSYFAPAQTLVRLNLAFQLYSPAQSDVNNFAVVAYVGTTPPRSEADFQVIGYTDTAAGWQQYKFQKWQLTGRDPTYVWVAFGISSAWEYSREYYMDDVTVSIKP